MATPTYELLKDFNGVSGEGYLSIDAHWAVAVVRLGHPLSFSRAKLASDTTDLTQTAMLRAQKPFVITGDCINLTVSSSKASHTKSLSAVLKQTNYNYLVELLPGDWILAWMVNNQDSFSDLLKRINKADASDPCNKAQDGLKFVGRIHSIRKIMSVNAGTGVKTCEYQIQGVGFSELDTTIFYDHSLATRDQVQQDIGTWLSRIGRNIEELYASDQRTGIQDNNVNVLIPTLIDVIVGKGLAKETNVTIAAGPTGQEKAQQTAGGGADKSAPNAYVIPTVVGALLGRSQSDASKPVLSYCDILTLLQGVQDYSDEKSFVPDLDDSKTTAQRLVTKTPMLGTFLPFMPEFTNRPLWGVLQQFLNPAINEIYTCLRTNSVGLVVPTIVLRQIPFTTDVFDTSANYVKSRIGSTNQTSLPSGDLPFTRFLDLPRWKLDGTMIHSVNIGRSDATRVNFVHVYGACLQQKAHNVPIGAQIVFNPPIRDDLDIQRSGVHPYMTTINCAVQDETDGTPGLWMALVADFLMGSQYTLNGTIQCALIQSAIPEGDNLEWDEVVYHIESITHSCSVDPQGNKSATSTLTLTNGMRSEGNTTRFSDTPEGAQGSGAPGSSNDFPIYPGIVGADQTSTDPGHSIDGAETTGPNAQAEDGDVETPPLKE